MTTKPGCRNSRVVVDSSALVSIILREPDEDGFARAMLAAASVHMSAANWVEAAILLDSRRLRDGHIRLEDVIDRFRIEIVPVTAEIAARARSAHQRFGRGNHPARLNYGDCFAYATASHLGEPLLFKGGDFSQTDIPSALPVTA